MFLVFAMNAGLVYLSSARTCNVACAVEILSPSFQCASGADIGTMYANKCFECAGTVMSWGCPSSVPLPACIGSGTGTKLVTTACSTQVMTAAELELAFGAGAAGNCVEYLGTDIRAQPNGESTSTLADLGQGPGVILITTDAEAAASNRAGTCRNASLARQSLLAEGALCFTVPASISLRGLLQPGLGLFIVSFMVQAIGAVLLASCFGMFRG